MLTELLQLISTLNFRVTSKNVIMGTFACIISSCSTKSGHKRLKIVKLLSLKDYIYKYIKRFLKILCNIYKFYTPLCLKCFSTSIKCSIAIHLTSNSVCFTKRHMSTSLSFEPNPFIVEPTKNTPQFGYKV